MDLRAQIVSIVGGLEFELANSRAGARVTARHAIAECG